MNVNGQSHASTASALGQSNRYQLNNGLVRPREGLEIEIRTADRPFRSPVIILPTLFRVTQLQW
jgi:hypothetical protein